jgi:thymidylate synthase
LFPKLLSSRNQVSTSRGHAREIFSVLLELKHPRARLSRSETRGKPFSCLGEFLWYLSRDNKLDFIRYYISAYEKETEDGETIYGGYGPRLFDRRGYGQLQNVITLLKDRPESRRAVIQLFDAEDIARRHKEVPCTCTLQFLVRHERLHLLTTMRSNDAYKGLPHDIFCFTMLQEVVARTLGVELGSYSHFVGSLHLYDDERDGYDDDREAAQQYLDEGVQSTILMPPMPSGDPWPSIKKLLDAEYRIRHRVELDANVWGVDDYWTDQIRLLQILAASGDAAKIEALKTKMVFKGYAPYIDGRMTSKPPVVQPPKQFLLRF